MTVYDVLWKRDEHKGSGIWIKCGVILQKEDGRMSLKIDAVPVCKEFDGWLVVSERRQRQATDNPENSVPF